MESYDVIIVGAGPAGLECANQLKNSGLSVLLIEKNKIIGPKVCAGGLTNHDLEYLNLPKKLLDCQFKELTLHTPFNTDIIKLDKSFIYTIDRKTLGQWQLKKLNTGIKVRKESRVTDIKENRVVINDSKKVRFKYLVGADGSSSIVRRFVGLKTSNLDIAVQYIIPTKKYKKIELFFDSELFHSWFAWIFPHKDYVSIGCGCNTKYLSAKKLVANFNKWLKKNNIDISKGEYQAHPINFDYQGYRFNNIFLAGDAAGLASGFSGEGIYPALVSGGEIAKMIVDKTYVSDKMEELMKIKHFHNRVLRFLERSGPIRKIEYELLALLLKSKLIDKKLISMIT
jgi:geranylgeranyl reductase